VSRENVLSATTPADLVGDGLMRVPEAAQFLSVSRSTVYQLMDEGALCFVKIGRCRRIPRRAVIKLAAAELRGGSQFK
jgi:excisionase family DNA binding protein